MACVQIYMVNAARITGNFGDTTHAVTWLGKSKH